MKQTTGAAAMHVRRAERSDQDELRRLWLAFLEEQADCEPRFRPSDDAAQRWDNDFAFWIQDDRRRVLVAEEEGALVGFTTAERWTSPPIYAVRSEVYLDELYVDVNARGRGIGAALVDQVVAWATAVGASGLRLNALYENEQARAFWVASGARPFAVTYVLDVERDQEMERKGHPTKGRLGF